MYRKIKLLICSICFIPTLASLNGCSKETSLKLEESNKNIRLVVDTKNIKKLPTNFRKTTDKINTISNEAPNLDGLSTLNASGSAQFSESGLTLVKQAIGAVSPITILDLRQESHGFINGMAVSWTDADNKANKGLTKDEVLADENSKLQSLELGKAITIYEGNKEETIVPIKVQSEDELIKNERMTYIRIPVTDKEKPTDSTVDYFIQSIRSLPPGTWLHFHCKHGLGRTTTFMVMYDAMKNAKKVSLEDIMKRQILIGGENLLEPTNKESNVETYTYERSEFIRKFYKYCKENNDNFRTTWSEWLKNLNTTSMKKAA